MGLKTPVSRQLLLRGKPDTFENAIEAAREIELVLEFESKPMELNAKISSVEDCDTGLQAALKDLMERLGNMEAQIQSVVQIVQCSVAAGISKTKAEARGTEQEAGRRHVRPVSYDDRRRSRRMCCFRCGEEGHIKRFCPLNFNGPAGTANGSRLGARCMNVRQYRDPLHFGCNVSNINSLLCIDGNVGKRSVNMLLDSGAAVSVIRSGVLEDRSRNLVMATSRTAIGANGLPLNVMGQVDLDICLGNFRTVHTFIVVRDLTFECILGADYFELRLTRL